MSLKIPSFFRYQFPALIWAVMIFIASSIPASRLPKFAHYVNDKIIHLSIFFILGLLVYRALYTMIPGLSFNMKRGVFAVVIVVLYGISDEFHQGFVPGRTVDVMDATADAAGGLLSVLIVYAVSLLSTKSQA